MHTHTHMHACMHESLLQVVVLAKGARAVHTAVKAIATARDMARDRHSVDIAMQPVLQPNPQNKPEQHQILMYLYRIPLASAPSSSSSSTSSGNGNGNGSSGGHGVEGEELIRVGQATLPKALAGHISGRLLRAASEGSPAGSRATVQAAGGIAVYK
jgi:stage V sporulation protein SpoVS